MSRIIVLIVVSMSLISVANARIHRSCSGNFIVTNLSSPNSEPVYIDSFKARAGCPNYNPNLCRRRAKKRIKACVIEHWKMRGAGYKPYECTPQSGMTKYRWVSLSEELFTSVCRIFHENGIMHATIKFRTGWKSRCVSHGTLSHDFTIDCSQYSPH